MTALREWVMRWSMTAWLAASVGACGGIGDEGKLPPNVQDPATLKTPSGAIARYHGAVRHMRFAFEGAILHGGVLTDELADLPAPLGQAGQYTALDSRQNLEPFAGSVYDSLHRARAQAREARGFLAAYAPDSSPALQAHLLAIEGYAEILLADLFCSGVPLSTVDFDGDYTFAQGSTTTQVYQHAAALFDSALAIASDSAKIEALAALGRARALLAIGEFRAAAEAAARVPDGYVYQVQVPARSAGLEGTTYVLTGLTTFGQFYGTLVGVPSVADLEGGNGLDFRSSNDPRMIAVPLGDGLFGGTMYYPDTSRFALAISVSYTLASGVEARLIEAEAAWQTGADDWLAKLNALRTDGTFDTQPNSADPSRTDTLWHAGSGGVPGLRPLADPGSADARVNLLFRERAFWLYLSGHRQGDLRRLVREYFRGAETLYPVGAYQGGQGRYGTEITMPVPKSERELNPKYAGCFNRDA